MINFGEAMKKARKAKRITLRVLGEHVGKSVGYLSDVENGRKKPPKLEVVQNIESFLEITDESLTKMAKKLRGKMSDELSARIMLMPKWSEALLRADEDLTDEQLNRIMNIVNESKNRKGEN